MVWTGGLLRKSNWRTKQETESSTADMTKVSAIQRGQGGRSFTKGMGRLEAKKRQKRAAAKGEGTDEGVKQERPITKTCGDGKAGRVRREPERHL